MISFSRYFFVFIILCSSAWAGGGSFRPAKPELYQHIVEGAVIEINKIMTIDGVVVESDELSKDALIAYYSKMKIEGKPAWLIETYTGLLQVSSVTKGSLKAGDKIPVIWTGGGTIKESGRISRVMCPHISRSVASSSVHKFGLFERKDGEAFWKFVDRPVRRKLEK